MPKNHSPKLESSAIDATAIPVTERDDGSASCNTFERPVLGKRTSHHFDSRVLIAAAAALNSPSPILCVIHASR